MSPRISLAVFVALILYGSFFPFHFDPRRFQDGMEAGIFEAIPFSYSGPGDTIANLIAYIPIGIFLRLSLSKLQSWRGYLLTVACGMLLSLCIEIGQLATVTRSSNFYDVLMNTISTAIGAMLAHAIWLRLEPLFDAARHSGTPVIAWLLALVWTGIHAAPFAPTLAMSKLRAALAPLRHFPWTLEGTTRWFAAWLIMAAVVHALVPRRLFVRALAATVAVSLCMRLAFTGQTLSINELLGLLYAVPIVFFLPTLSASGALVGMLVSGLAPYRLQSQPSPVGWIPFVGILGNDFGQVYPVVLEKAFLYGGSVWLLHRSGLGRVASGVCVAVVLAAIEWTQRYLPGRTPEVSDPIIALLVIMLLDKNREKPR